MAALNIAGTGSHPDIQGITTPRHTLSLLHSPNRFSPRYPGDYDIPSATAPHPLMNRFSPRYPGDYDVRTCRVARCHRTGSHPDIQGITTFENEDSIGEALEPVLTPISRGLRRLLCESCAGGFEPVLTPISRGLRRKTTLAPFWQRRNRFSPRYPGDYDLAHGEPGCATSGTGSHPDIQGITT